MPVLAEEVVAAADVVRVEVARVVLVRWVVGAAGVRDGQARAAR